MQYEVLTMCRALAGGCRGILTSLRSHMRSPGSSWFLPSSCPGISCFCWREQNYLLFSGTAFLLHARAALDLLRYPKVTRSFVILRAAILRTARRAEGWLPETRCSFDYEKSRQRCFARKDQISRVPGRGQIFQVDLCIAFSCSWVEEVVD